jgi:predicted  nucleic acid-binding Zn-ribbon protein
MGDEERESIARQVALLTGALGRTEAKVDVAIERLAEIREDRIACRDHCDKTTADIYDRLTAKFNPAWIYGVGIIALVVLEILRTVKGH